MERNGKLEESPARERDPSVLQEDWPRRVQNKQKTNKRPLFRKFCTKNGTLKRYTIYIAKN